MDCLPTSLACLAVSGSHHGALPHPILPSYLILPTPSHALFLISSSLLGLHSLPCLTLPSLSYTPHLIPYSLTHLIPLTLFHTPYPIPYLHPISYHLSHPTLPSSSPPAPHLIPSCPSYYPFPFTVCPWERCSSGLERRRWECQLVGLEDTFGQHTHLACVQPNSCLLILSPPSSPFSALSRPS
jgi:hypothetical protein